MREIDYNREIDILIKMSLHSLFALLFLSIAFVGFHDYLTFFQSALWYSYSCLTLASAAYFRNSGGRVTIRWNRNFAIALLLFLIFLMAIYNTHSDYINLFYKQYYFRELMIELPALRLIHDSFLVTICFLLTLWTSYILHIISFEPPTQHIRKPVRRKTS